MTPFPCECHASMFANKGNDAIVANEWPQHDAEVNVGHNMLMDAQTIERMCKYINWLPPTHVAQSCRDSKYNIQMIPIKFPDPHRMTHFIGVK